MRQKTRTSERKAPSRPAIAGDELRRQRRVVREWSDMPEEFRRRLVERLTGQPTIPELAKLLADERSRWFMEERPTALRRALCCVEQLIREKAIADGEAVTITADVEAFTATLIVRTDDGLESRFELQDDDLTHAVATRHAVNARGRA